mmetsp:Transcript_50529/g.152231  ORF Transcript_50529/g.152231 Transcript_50529/m.152231 type:complete len:266 (-) Transcript_50529:5253-6050(-)
MRVRWASTSTVLSNIVFVRTSLSSAIPARSLSSDPTRSAPALTSPSLSSIIPSRRSISALRSSRSLVNASTAASFPALSSPASANLPSRPSLSSLSFSTSARTSSARVLSRSAALSLSDRDASNPSIASLCSLTVPSNAIMASSLEAHSLLASSSSLVTAFLSSTRTARSDLTTSMLVLFASRNDSFSTTAARSVSICSSCSFSRDSTSSTAALRRTSLSFISTSSRPSLSLSSARRDRSKCSFRSLVVCSSITSSFSEIAPSRL